MLTLDELRAEAADGSLDTPSPRQLFDRVVTDYERERMFERG